MSDEGPIGIDNFQLFLSGVAREQLAPAVPFTLELKDAVQETVARRSAEGSNQRARPQRPLGYQAVNHGLIGLLCNERHRPSPALLAVSRLENGASAKRQAEGAGKISGNVLDGQY
jgi:hypothetical protein